jgi:uncharacterized membrane protein YgaE (UPF0421/DUF939 family)
MNRRRQIPVKFHVSRFIGARLVKTGLAVSLATGLMSLVDPTRGLVGAGVSAAIMIAPDQKSGKEWARNQFIAAFAGALLGFVMGQFVGWAPWLTGIAAMLLITVFAKTGYTGAIVGGLGNALFILEHTDRGAEYAMFRFGASVVGLIVGFLVNRYVLPYRPGHATPHPVHQADQLEVGAD